MAELQVDPNLPEIKPDLRLIGWHRELCIELLGNGEARLFVRAVEKSSFKATELQRAILFQRLDSRFADLAGCVEFIRKDLALLADTARRFPAHQGQPVRHLGVRPCRLGAGAKRR